MIKEFWEKELIKDKLFDNFNITFYYIYNWLASCWESWLCWKYMIIYHKKIYQN